MDEYHQVRFDNLYMSAKFSLGLSNRPNRLTISGVSSTSSRGVPMQILQKEVTTKERINADTVYQLHKFPFYSLLLGHLGAGCLVAYLLLPVDLVSRFL